MGFWKTFIKVWQVRTSIRIQEGIEDAIMESRRERETTDNLPKIIHELRSKNAIWDREMEHQRKIGSDEE